MQTNVSSSVSIFINHETEFVFYREYRQIYFYLKKKNYIYLSWGTNELSDPDIANKVTNI